MSEPLSILVDDKSNYDGIKEILRSVKGSELTERIDAPDRYHFIFNEIEFCLDADCDLEDDYGMPLSNYSVAIDMYRLKRGRKYKSYEILFLAFGDFLAEKIARDLECSTLLVANLSRQISAYDFRKLGDSH